MDKKQKHQEEYLLEVKQQLLNHKWIESEKAKKDLGQVAVMDWIKRYAKIHRKEYIDKKLIKAEIHLSSLKENSDIPKTIINLLEDIYDCIDCVKDNIEVNDPSLPSK